MGRPPLTGHPAFECGDSSEDSSCHEGEGGGFGDGWVGERFDGEGARDGWVLDDRLVLAVEGSSEKGGGAHRTCEESGKTGDLQESSGRRDGGGQVSVVGVGDEGLGW